ncbi:MAG: 16S rRNA (cytosine(967)-C(5))-methyltransferase RsmB [Lachnospiraceae bacterium]|nr:16S rRNA (cytosine(967)-C(5))-methyltransferase RsmB [Lachnospiraceae bacterium]
MAKTNTREIALSAITEIMENGAYSHLLMKQVLDKYAYLPKQERSFIKRLTDGCVERAIELDFVIDCYSKTKVNKMKPFIRNLMRMSVYQILYMDSVPDSAACNEAVKLAVAHKFSGLKGFVNGVLRTVARQKNEIPYPEIPGGNVCEDVKKREAAVKALSIHYSMPEWIVTRFLGAYGFAKTEEMLNSFLCPRALSIRLDESLPEEKREDILTALKERCEVKAADEKLAYAYYLRHVDRPEELPGYEDGVFYLQDIGAMEIVETAHCEALFDAKKAQGSGIFTVIDVCGAPGGKALHVADKLKAKKSAEDEIFIRLRDKSDAKIALIEDNLDRFRAKYDPEKIRIEAEVVDATSLSEDDIETADLVIADLPCSGLGVIGRKADVKYHTTNEDVAFLAALQRKILSTVWRYVAPNGHLLYSTCTLTKEENEENAAWFSEQFPFEKVEEHVLFPRGDETDGFYAVLFRKKDEDDKVGADL